MIIEKPNDATHVHFYDTGGYDVFKIYKEQDYYIVLLWNISVWIDYTNMCDVEELNFLLEYCKL